MPKTRELKLFKIKQDTDAILKIHPNLPSIPGFIIICGPPGTGKTHIMGNMCANLYNEDDKHIFFKRIIWISPTVQTDTGLKGLREFAEDPDNDKIEIQLLPPKGEDLDLEPTLTGVINYLKEQQEDDRQEKINTCLIIDDSMSRMRRDVKSELSKLATTYRHLSNNLTVLLGVQNWKGCPKCIRDLCSAVIVTGANGRTRHEIDDDYNNIYGDIFKTILEDILENKFQFIYIDNRDKKIFRNFDKLEYSKD